LARAGFELASSALPIELSEVLMVFRSLSEVLMVFRRVAFSNLGWLMEGKYFTRK
jgi:hypothetical protein